MTGPLNPEWFGWGYLPSVRISNFSRSRNFFARPTSHLARAVRRLRLLAAGKAGGLGCRGVTSAMLAGSAAILFGFAGLAVEAGNWYLSLRNAVTAADLAALSGAAALDRGEDYKAVALNTAAQNGFRDGVTICPPVCDSAACPAECAKYKDSPSATDPAAVRVIVSKPQSISLARLFLDAAPTVSATAVATTHNDGDVCLLALSGGLQLGGNSSTTSKRCMLGSNSASGITVAGSASVSTAGLITTGPCTGCYDRNGRIQSNITSGTSGVPPQIITNRPSPIPDPFDGLRNWTPPLTGTCLPTPTFTNRQATLSPGLVCENIKINNNETLNLSSGLYIFKNASLDVEGGATINGTGVTLVFAGDPGNVGTVTINGNAKGTLTGPTETNIPGHPEARGLLMYRIRTPNSGPVMLNGNGTMTLSGGMYFPDSDVQVNGNADLGSTCLSIIGGLIYFSGNAETTIGVAGCSNYKPYPSIRTVRLVE